MGYIGSQPANAYTTFSKQDLTGTTCSAGASVTLNNSVTTASDIRLVINNVIQEPDTSYTCSGNQLTILNTPVVASDDWYVVFLSKALQSVNPPDNSVGYVTHSSAGNSESNEGADHAQLNYEGIGNDTGEGMSGWLEFQNVNNALFSCGYTGMANVYKDSTHYQHWNSGIFKRASYASAVNGLRFYMSSGNIAEGTIQVYGVAE